MSSRARSARKPAKRVVEPQASDSEEDDHSPVRRSSKKEAGAGDGKKKRKAAPYANFTQAMTPKIMERFPELGFGARAKTLSKIWKHLDDTTKDSYRK